MKIISGFEPTRIITKENGLDRLDDVLGTTQHLTMYEEDFNLVQEVGLDTLRIAVPWHRIEVEQGKYDWDWTDGYMESLRKRGIDPILDPLHHVSIPSWLTKGFVDHRFVDRYSSFFIQLVMRYPWVTKYTIINEPLVTTYFATHEGIWYPFKKSKEDFEEGLRNIEQIILNMSIFLYGHRKEHWYVEPAEYHIGLCEEGYCMANDRNFHRFQLLDRLLERGVKIDILGLDYYPHCEFAWDYRRRVHMEKPLGFYELAKQYVDRYKLPIALTETNIRGFVEDRLSWFLHMWEQCKKLENEGVDIRAFCWYPFIDSTDWDSLLQQVNKNIDPVGIIWLDKDMNRHRNVFSDALTSLIKGASIDEIPRYEFRPPLDESLKSFVNMHMCHWNWQKVGDKKSE